MKYQISKKRDAVGWWLGVGASEGGQVLLEVLVALVVGAMIAVTFVSLGAISVRNSRFAADQVAATKFAQEGIEAMITIRDQNVDGAILNNGVNDKWSELFGQVMSCPQPDDPTSDCPSSDFVLPEGFCTIGTPPKPQRCIQKTLGGITLSAPNNRFTRKIRITDDPSNSDVKNVTVFVHWTDAQGLHKSIASRKIYKQRL